jgi:L-asparaginase
MPIFSSSPRITIFTLGGTVLMARQEAGDGIMPSEKALRGLEEMTARGVAIEMRPLFQLASGSLSLSNLYDLACAIETAVREGSDGIVVVQGTDTLEETAYAVGLMIKPNIPVIFTGAMRASDAAGADGQANIADAVATARASAAKGIGVLVVMGGEIHAAQLVCKTHSFLPSAFSSPGYGPIGSVREGRADIIFKLAQMEAPIGKFGLKAPPVCLYTAALGEDGRFLRQLPELRYGGLIVAGFGAGHVPQGLLADLQNLAKAMPVVLCSRTQAGAALTRTYGYPGGEISLIKAGIIPCTHLSALKARLMLTGLLELGADRAAIAAHFQRV